MKLAKWIAETVKQNKFKASLILVLIFASYSTISHIIQSKNLQNYVSETLADYDFVNSWEITGNVLTIYANEAYEILDIKTKYLEGNDIRKRFRNAIIDAKKIHYTDTNTIFLQEVTVKINHEHGIDNVNRYQLTTADRQIYKKDNLIQPTIPVVNSTDNTKEVLNYCYSRYDYYDKLNGGYGGDKYTNNVFSDASAKFGISVSEVHDIWSDGSYK